ncbi:hypothetical protein Tco_1505048 [Tanacetum coccineum]
MIKLRASEANQHKVIKDREEYVMRNLNDKGFESNVDDNAEGDEDKGIDGTINLLYDDVDVRLNEPVHADEGLVQKEGTDAEMINVQQGNENLEITLDQVIEDAHVTISTAAKKTKDPITSSSHSSDLASNFLIFADILPIDAEIISLMDGHVHHEVPSNQTHTLLTLPVTVITKSLPVCTTTIPQSLPSFTPPPPLSTPTPPPTTEATNPQSTLPDFTFVFQFNNRVSALEKAVSELREEDHLKTQLKKILINKIEKSQSYLTATGHRECYDGLIKSYELDKSLLSTYDNVYSLKRSRKDKDKDEDPSAGSDRGLKKRKTSKDVEPTKGPKTKESKSGSSKGTKSQSTSFGKSVQTEELEFEVADSDMPQN